jgi:hypothetical protein
VWMTAVVEKNVLLWHWMRLSLLFLFGRHMYNDDVRFGIGLIFFFPFISLLYASVFKLPMKKKNTASLELLFFSDSIPILSILFGKITSS